MKAPLSKWADGLSGYAALWQTPLVLKALTQIGSKLNFDFTSEHPIYINPPEVSTYRSSPKIEAGLKVVKRLRMKDLVYEGVLSLDVVYGSNEGRYQFV